MSKQSNMLSQLEQVATYIKNLNYENRRLKMALDAKMLALYKDDLEAIIITEAPVELMISSRTDGNDLYSYRKEMEEWAKKAGMKVFVVQEKAALDHITYNVTGTVPDELYKCLSCEDSMIEYRENFCSNCGVKAEWK